MAEKLLFIACGGGIGAALRYVISAWASAHGGAVFPYGTALVNIIGSFLIGLSASYFAVHATLPPDSKTLYRYRYSRRFHDIFHIQPRVHHLTAYGQLYIRLYVCSVKYSYYFSVLFCRPDHR